jgi:hypothetical protein
MGNQRPKFQNGMLLLVFLLAISSLQAQRIISGKVTDASSGEALIGANVLLTGSNIGTITDLEGMYKLEVPDNLKKISFSYTGYSEQIVEIGQSNQIDIALRAGQLLDEIKIYSPELLQHAETSLPSFLDDKTKDHSKIEIPLASFKKCPNISIDYALMEKATNVYVLPATFDWNDLGTWGQLHEKIDKDENNNGVINAKVILENASNNIIRSDANKVIVIDGLHDYIIVDKEGVLMIYPKSKEQDIKRITSLANKL